MYFWDPAFGSRFLMTFVWGIGVSDIACRVGWRRGEAMQVCAQAAGTGKEGTRECHDALATRSLSRGFDLIRIGATGSPSRSASLGLVGGRRWPTFMISVLFAYMSRRAFFLASRLEMPASSCPKSLTTLPIGAAGAAWLALCGFGGDIQKRWTAPRMESHPLEAPSLSSPLPRILNPRGQGTGTPPSKCAPKNGFMLTPLTAVR
jgi:hypothetical protein